MWNTQHLNNSDHLKKKDQGLAPIKRRKKGNPQSQLILRLKSPLTSAVRIEEEKNDGATKVKTRQFVNIQ